MEPEGLNVEQGFLVGLSRSEVSLGKRYSPEEMPKLPGKIVEAFRRYPLPLSGRFVELFTEMAVISEASRLYYEYPRLTDGDLDKFLHPAVDFFDSFTHK